VRWLTFWTKMPLLTHEMNADRIKFIASAELTWRPLFPYALSLQILSYSCLASTFSISSLSSIIFILSKSSEPLVPCFYLLSHQLSYVFRKVNPTTNVLQSLSRSVRNWRSQACLEEELSVVATWAYVFGPHFKEHGKRQWIFWKKKELHWKFPFSKVEFLIIILSKGHN